ncbi:hypothetical protein GCWU000324_03121 [Kingella oralis ATCC 51147]|uniref:Uncharacterized protein n=1 Tax=Kingella oralis ATCC 51147 TaxID=629741 RepID=C4GN32_9NEIS|nr:hypothetical protein GCWU000324_03121 [Kingella oralis ATCC 51147]
MSKSLIWVLKGYTAAQRARLKTQHKMAWRRLVAIHIHKCLPQPQ